jgi:polyhydroxyalkanoate synthesis regulator phasin
MTKISNARDRAEELLQNLQKTARELLDAEEGLIKAVRAMVEQNGFSAAEVKKRLEEMVGRIKANNLWERVAKSDTAVAIADYRGQVERRASKSVKKLLSSFPVANKNEVAELTQQVKALNNKVLELAKRLDSAA